MADVLTVETVSVEVVQVATSTTEVVEILGGAVGQKGDTGRAPVVSMSGDRITVDGVEVGPNLTGPASTEPGPAGADSVVPGPKGDKGDKGDRGDDGADSNVPGPAGHSPVVTMTGDQVTIDGVVAGPHLTGPKGDAGLDGDDGADSTIPGPKGDKGDTGDTGASATAMTCALDFGDEGNVATVVVSHTSISPDSSIVATITGENAEEAVIQGVTVGVLSQGEGGCTIIGGCTDGASGIFNVNLHIV